MKTTIEWTDMTWNPLVGCTRVRPGCEHCYAETMAARQVLMTAGRDAKAREQGKPPGAPSVYLPVVDAQRRRWTRSVELLPDRLEDPLSYKPGTRVFVVSMGDPFHDEVPFEFLDRMWRVMAAAPAVIFQVLTKRPRRMVDFLRWLELSDAGWPHLAGMPGGLPLPNVWLGVSVEDRKYGLPRVDILRTIPALLLYVG